MPTDFQYRFDCGIAIVHSEGYSEAPQDVVKAIKRGMVDDGQIAEGKDNDKLSFLNHLSLLIRAQRVKTPQKYCQSDLISHKVILFYQL